MYYDQVHLNSSEGRIVIFFKGIEANKINQYKIFDDNNATQLILKIKQKRI